MRRLAGVALLLAAPLAGRAQEAAGAPAEPHDLDPLVYSGAFRSLEAGAGPSWLAGELGGAAFAAARVSAVLHLADVEVAYHVAHVPEADATLHRLGVGVNLHPLFLFLLTGDALGATLASLHVRFGLAPSLAAAGGDFEAGVAWDWGVGMDLPLTALDAAESFWLGAQYVRVSALDDGPFEDEVAQSVYLRVAYRVHGL